MTGCTKVPQNGAMLSASVTLGIERMEAQTEAVIKALADTERGILDEKWETIYRSCESKYRKKYDLAATSPLSPDQQFEVATIAVGARDKILMTIAKEESELSARAQTNAKHVIDANRAVQEYLLSLQELDAARRNAEHTVTDLTGIELGKLVKTSEQVARVLQ